MNAFKKIQILFAVSILSLTAACNGSSSNLKQDSYLSANRPADTTGGLTQEKIEEDGSKGRLPPQKGAGNGVGSGRGTGGGGGGGREASSLVTQQISLTQTAQAQIAPAVERKIIRNADLQLETDAPPETQQKIAQIVESKNGFVIESTQSSSNTAATRDVVTMTARVPAAKFEESLSEIRGAASRVIVETVKGEDVTEEFIDIEARLKSQKALEAQFIEIMKQAKSVEDALDVQSKLADVRGEIEKVEGRKKFLENQASFSTIKIRLQTPVVFSANSEGFFYRLRQSASSGFDFAVNFLLGLVSFVIGALPFVLLIVLPLLLVIRYLWRKWRRRKTAVEIAREEIKNE